MDAALVRGLFDYDPATGVLSHAAGKLWRRDGPVGSKKEDGYLRVGVYGRLYYVHRLAWLHHFGEWPKHQIDHINGNRSDNRIANLRDVDAPTNGLNRHLGAGSAGVVGAQRSGGRFQCFVKIDGRRIYLGKFTSPEDAGAARQAALTAHGKLVAWPRHALVEKEQAHANCPPRRS